MRVLNTALPSMRTPRSASMEEREVSARRKSRAIFAVTHCRRHRHVLRSSSTGEEAWLPPLPLKQLMKYAIPAVLALLLLRYQYKPDTLFQENRAPIWSFVAATACYWLVAEVMARCRRRYGRMLSRVALAVGIQSALSLLSMFLPHPFSLLPLLLIPVPISLFFACTWILALLIKIFQTIAVWTGGVEVTTQPDISPV